MTASVGPIDFPEVVANRLESDRAGVGISLRQRAVRPSRDRLAPRRIVASPSTSRDRMEPVPGEHFEEMLLEAAMEAREALFSKAPEFAETLAGIASGVARA
eukprot:5604490-Pyramimonas_sp.AAC.1